MSDRFPVLAISGPVGVGKTSVLVEIHDVLSNAEIAHGCIERDALSYFWPPKGRFNEEIVERNLACVVSNFLDAGAKRLLIAGVIESDSDLTVYRRCIPNAEIQVCRLTADLALREKRLRSREIGAGLEWHLNRTAELDIILNAADIDDFVVVNNDRPIRDVSIEVLLKAGWPAA